MERGNLIFFSVYLFSLYIFSKNDFQRIIYFSLLLNLKPYFILIYFLELLRFDKENKKFLLLTPVFSIFLLVTSGLIFNQEYYLLPANLYYFSSNAGLSAQEIFALPMTVSAFRYLNDLNSRINFDILFLYIPAFLIYVLLFMGVVKVCRKKFTKDYFLIFSGLFIINYSINTGGYSALYYLPILALLYKNREFLILLIITFTIFVGLWDMLLLFPVGKWDFYVYLSGVTLEVVPYLSLGGIVRPLANFAVLLLFLNTNCLHDYAKINKI
jgi:hypothetical protein